MARESFHQELNRVVEEVVQLGRETASRHVGLDSHYKERGAQIEEECMVLQARQAPVARDLRLIHTAQTVTNHHLVRTGTLCEHIWGAIVETADVERDPDLQTTILEMSSIARDLFREGLDVFDNRDIDHAQSLQAEDD
jgi:phosphate transport system protein